MAAGTQPFGSPPPPASEPFLSPDIGEKAEHLESSWIPQGFLRKEDPLFFQFTIQQKSPGAQKGERGWGLGAEATCVLGSS